ncbi:MAG: 30S ribosomal protein S2, partial [Dermatophilaceae bacterium]|nr:30S ribosomal protein S2 [Dermatophilaceae bacterium]
LMARAGGRADEDVVAADEPLAEWERELLGGDAAEAASAAEAPAAEAAPVEAEVAEAPAAEAEVAEAPAAEAEVAEAPADEAAPAADADQA